LEKIQAVAAWPAAMQDLRVCLHGEERDENCCRCEKCVRTILGFRVLGLGLPACFKEDAGFVRVLGVKNANSMHNIRLILDETRARRLRRPWVYALHWAYFTNETRIKLRSMIRRKKRSNRRMIRG